MNTEHQFKELREQLDRLDTKAMQARIEAHLRLTWAEQHSTQPTHMNTLTTNKRWRWLSFTLGGSGLAALALITTFIIQPTTSNSKNQIVTSTLGRLDTSTDGLLFQDAGTGSTKAQGLTVDNLDTGFTMAGGLAEAMPLSADDDYAYDPYIEEEFQYNNSDQYQYEDGATTNELFDESVSLAVDVKGEMLDVVHTIRNEVNTLNGYLIDIAYYNDSGTINIKLPVDQLSTFEDALKELDANQTVEVHSYNVVNVSDEVVTIDEQIKAAKDAIAQDETDLLASNLTDLERQAIANSITERRNYIEDQTTTRDEVIAKYNLVAVQVVVTAHQSFWEGNYQQYDRSTFVGQIQYELGRAIYSLIRTSGKLTRFLVWLAVYSVILVPLFWLVRAIIRKLIDILRQKS